MVRELQAGKGCSRECVAHDTDSHRALQPCPDYHLWSPLGPNELQGREVGETISHCR
jgi:hypothetical protein